MSEALYSGPKKQSDLERVLRSARKDALKRTLRAIAGNPRAERAIVQLLAASARGEKIPNGISLIDFERQQPTDAERAQAKLLSERARASLASKPVFAGKH